MRSKGTMLAACALLAIGSACAHDSQRERASVSAVTNDEVSPNEAPDKTRMHYTEVSDEHALGRDQDVHTTLPEGNGVPREKSAQVQACELEVYFATNSATLDERSQHSLDTVADCIKRHEVDHATIVGSADPSGTKERNDQLSLERAKVVAEYLRGRGVAEDDIHVRSKGAVAQSDRQLWPVERNADVKVTR
ncbi:MAG TPA: OmpA family protein [Polyangiales bacterium]|nr:OmpA family protein [Polyangiales bacterium]